MSVSLSARGYSDGTEPEVLNLAASDFASMYTFTRASAATITDIDGMLSEVGVDVPRLVQYDGEGNALGLLIEEQRTNLWTYSEDFTNAVWTKLSGNITSAGVTAPDGAASSLVLNGDGANAIHAIEESTGSYTAGDKLSISVFMKNSGGSGSFGFITIRTTNFSLATLIVNLIDGTITSASGGDSYEVKGPIMNGWYRVSLTATAVNTGTSRDINIGVTTNPTNTTSSSSNSIYLFGAQLEEGSPSSYIPTAGTQVTRAADDCVRVLGDEFNPNEGTVYVEFKVLTVPLDTTILVSFNDGTTSNRALEIGFKDNGALQIFTSGVSPSNTLPYVVGQTYRIATSFNDTKMGVAVDGVLDSQNGAPTATGLNQIQVGKLAGLASSDATAIVKDLQYFPTALTEAELITLTGGT